MIQSSIIDLVQNTLQTLDGTKIYFDPPADGPREGRYANPNQSSLHPYLTDLISKAAPQGLYSHQHDAIECSLAGNNTIVATRTSSGKSLIFALPAMNNLCKDPNSTSLFLYPQKALANDQFGKLTTALQHVPYLADLQKSKPLLISRYDSSVPDDVRKASRDQAQMLLTNPDMLHIGILQHHMTHWSRFFKNLKLVAIDECHEYRGIFGTNVSYILRRLRQICAIHGSNPQFIATSATITDPQAHMHELVGCDFELIDASQDGSKQGRRKFWMAGSDEHYYDYGRKLAIALAEQGLRVLTFCPSRIAAERMLSRMRKPTGELADYVAVYRSGLRSEERESIETQLREGTKKLVFSTSALELGIDIGGLDVVICLGLPNSMMSLWQRAGRVARAGREGAIILIPGDSPLDAYFAVRPNELFSRDNESLALNLTNARVACQHYACAVAETGTGESGLALSVLGRTVQNIQNLRDAGKLSRSEFYCHDPHREISIRNTGESNYRLLCDNEEVGEIGSFHLLREAPRGAIYRHNGMTYRVLDVIKGKKIVRLRPERTRHETISLVRTKIRQKSPLVIRQYSLATLALARIDVTEFLQSITEKDASGKSIRVSQPPGMPTHFLPTEGVALNISYKLVASLEPKMTTSFEIALGSIERLMANLFPIVSGPCDSQDFSSGIERTASGEYVLYLYDNVYDGVNLTSIAFDSMYPLLTKVQDRITSCECQDDCGCIRCIADPTRNTTSSKTDTLLLCKQLLAMFECEKPSTTHFAPPGSGIESSVMEIECPICNSHISSAARFCSNCGHRIEDIQNVSV